MSDVLTDQIQIFVEAERGDGGPVRDHGRPERVEESEEETCREGEEERGERPGETLLGEGSVGVEDA